MGREGRWQGREARSTRHIVTTCLTLSLSPCLPPLSLSLSPCLPPLTLSLSPLPLPSLPSPSPSPSLLASLSSPSLPCLSPHPHPLPLSLPPLTLSLSLSPCRIPRMNAVFQFVQSLLCIYVHNISTVYNYTSLCWLFHFI